MYYSYRSNIANARVSRLTTSSLLSGVEAYIQLETPARIKVTEIMGLDLGVNGGFEGRTCVGPSPTMLPTNAEDTLYQCHSIYFGCQRSTINDDQR